MVPFQVVSRGSKAVCVVKGPKFFIGKNQKNKESGLHISSRENLGIASASVHAPHAPHAAYP